MIARSLAAAGTLRQIRLLARALREELPCATAHMDRETNTRLLWHARQVLRRADLFLFTGSPPYLLHWIAPLNLAAAQEADLQDHGLSPGMSDGSEQSPGLPLQLIYRLTMFWRRRVDEFEVLGHDQMHRLGEVGIPSERVRLKRDPSPVRFRSRHAPAVSAGRGGRQADPALFGKLGHCARLRDVHRGLRLHHQRGSERLVLWLNAVGALSR